MTLLNTATAPRSKRKSKKAKSKRISQAEAERRQRQREQSQLQDWRARGAPPPAGDNGPPFPFPIRPVEQHRDCVLTLRQWCDLNGFSESTGRRILRSGTGPPVLQLSMRRIGIKVSANAAWQASRAR
jgi:hypothetical protein